MRFLLQLTPPVSFFIVSAITTFLSLAGLYLVRRKYSAEVLKENHEVAAIIFNAFGLFYGVLIAFVVFVTWNGYDDATKNLQLEASEAHAPLRLLFSQLDATSIPNRELYGESLRCLNNLAQYRRLRIFAGNDTVPPVIWLVLLVGGVFAVSYTFFFGMKNIRSQFLITTTFTVTLTSILFLIYVLDHPFTGTSRVSLAPLRQAMTTMETG